MTVQPDMHVGDYGTPFIMKIINRATNRPVPIASLTYMVILFEPPDGEDAFVRTAEMYSDTGVDGKIQYIFEDGDIDIAGTWKAQALVRDSDGEWHTDIVTFEVGENISSPSS